MSVVQPIPDTTDTTYYGRRTGLVDQPDLSMHTVLRTIYLQQNDLTHIFTECFPPQLQHLNLASNRFTMGLPAIWQDSIETLNLDHNSIPHTEFIQHWPSNLQELSMDDTSIKVTPENLPITLETLSVSGCNLHTIEHLPSYLRKLKANYNYIKKVEKLPRTLYYINLGQNLIRSSVIFKNKLPPNLRVLHLDCNQLTWIPSSWPDTLETLDLSNNQLTEFRSKLPANLKLLLLNNNRITDFCPEWPSTQLQQCSLYIRNNCIIENLFEYVHQGKLTSVYQLDNWNKITHHVYAKMIQYTFAKYMLKRGLRTWARVNKLYQELFETAMHPCRIGQFEPLPDWYPS